MVFSPSFNGCRDLLVVWSLQTPLLETPLFTTTYDQLPPAYAPRHPPHTTPTNTPHNRDKSGDVGHSGDTMTDFEVDKLIVVTSAKKGAKGQQLDQQLINDGLALYQEQLSEVGGCGWVESLMCAGGRRRVREQGRGQKRGAKAQGK